MMSIYLVVFAVTAALVSSTNIPSQVLELNEKFLDVMNDGLWFVEFYAPWCGHCKRLAPIWEQVGHVLAESNPLIRLGRVDCTRFSSVASSLDIHGFPTFRYGQQIVYDGDRTKDALVDFALKTSGPEVGIIDSVVRFTEMKKLNIKKPYFVLVTDTERVETPITKQYHETAKQLFSSAYLYESLPEYLPKALTPLLPELPSVVVFKDGRHKIFDPEKDTNLSYWMHSERWPAFPLISHANLYDIGAGCNKLLVLAVLDMVDRKKPDTIVGRFDLLLESAALDSTYSSSSTIGKNYQFGWLDGNEIASSIMLMAFPIPGVFVFNISSYEYYLSEDAPTQMTKESLNQWLLSIIDGHVKPLGGRSMMQRFKRIVYEVSTNVYSMFANQPLLTCCLFGLPIGFLAIICYSICSADFSVDREAIYPESDDDDGTDVDDHEKAD